ncbi:Zinc finger and SCAN domain-containing protein 10 [Microtus ochrogaster]|uniref:Zinc finger and SCAN domain-containing protein 10 n=1 Tax=Microtus ochrogaster TaxID=79684 RepID=A0A8J6GJD0_MICOH|nr:Zinc finger and SCAN domain-containing protein 10 [Microtus ochrogaster]
MEDPQECLECGKSFSRSSNLLHHLMGHTGSRPYSCALCGRGFSCNSHLLRHLRTYARETLYQLHPCSSSLAFQDISTYFSEEEWAKLSTWQKSVYVYMKRNYIRMTALGVTVNQPVFMRCKQQAKEIPVECIEVHGHESEGAGDIQVNVWSNRLRKRKKRVIHD